MRFASFIPLTALLLLFAGASAFPQSAMPRRSREEFTRALGKIKEGMTENQVIAIVGKPDDVRTERDPGGIGRVNTKEIWCYGTKGHLSFPTLGCVYIDKEGRTQETFGGQGKPPKSSLFTEDQLQELLRLLDTAPGLQGYSYDPLPLIQVVNTLQPLGREKVLAVIGEYLRVSDKWTGDMGPRYGLSLVLRVLFDLPDDVDPGQAALLGMPSPPGPKNPHQVPRFPIAVVDDIPLLLINGYELEGMPSPMEDVLDFFRKNGNLRSDPLVPTNDPLSALTNLMASTQWIYADAKLQQSYGFPTGEDASNNEREKAMLMEQLLRLIDSVYRLPTDVYGNRLPCGESPEPTWQKIVVDVSALKIKWDSQQQMYVFQNGLHLPKLTNKIHQREIWRLTGMGFEDAELILERKSDEWVDVMVSLTEKTGAKLKPATLALFSGDEKQQPILTFDFTNSVAAGGGSSEVRSIGLNPDIEIRAKLVIVGYRTNSSPVLKP
jgi:hypothetical protein